MQQILDELAKLVPVPWTVLLVVGCGFLAVVVLGLWDPRVFIPMSLLCYSASLFNSDILPFGAMDLRIPAAALALAFAMLRQRLPRLPTLAKGVFPAIFAYLFIGLLGMVVTSDVGAGVDAVVSSFLVVGVAWLIIGAASEEEIRGSLRIVSGFVLITSLILVFTMPGAAIEGGRWRGLMENANGLGLMSGIFLVTARSPAATRASLPLALAGLLGSASRASSLGAGLAVAPMFFREQSKALRMLAAVTAIAVALPLIHSVFFAKSDTLPATGSPELTRTQNSRSDFWADGVEVIRAHPVTGTGLGTQPPLISSSVLAPLTELGWFGLIPLCLVVAAGVLRMRYPAQRLRPLYIFMIVNCIFESWLFAGGSAFFLFFIFAAHPLRTDLAEPEPAEPEEADARRRRLNALVRLGPA